MADHDIGAQVEPASRVLRMVPKDPAAKPVFAEGKVTQNRSSVTPENAEFHVDPPSAVFKIVPSLPTMNPEFPLRK